MNFLDTTTKLEPNGSLSTTIFSKPTAAHQYLHRTSNHPPHTIRSIPKSQFIRVRRICTHLSDYWKNVNNFMKYFSKRGYQLKHLRKLANDVSTLRREDLLVYQVKRKSD